MSRAAQHVVTEVQFMSVPWHCELHIITSYLPRALHLTERPPRVTENHQLWSWTSVDSIPTNYYPHSQQLCYLASAKYGKICEMLRAMLHVATFTLRTESQAKARSQPRVLAVLLSPCPRPQLISLPLRLCPHCPWIQNCKTFLQPSKASRTRAHY